MTRIIDLLRTAALALILVASIGVSDGYAQVSTSVVESPAGVSMTRTVHHGRFSQSVSTSRGRFGHVCQTVRRSVRTGFGMRTQTVRRCR